MLRYNKMLIGLGSLCDFSRSREVNILRVCNQFTRTYVSREIFLIHTCKVRFVSLNLLVNMFSNVTFMRVI
jgi:hypothetical protein